MGSGVVVQSKSSSQIALEVFDLLEIGQQSGVNGLLNLLGFGSPGSLSLFQLLLSFSSGFGSVFKFAGSVFLV